MTVDRRGAAPGLRPGRPVRVLRRQDAGGPAPWPGPGSTRPPASRCICRRAARRPIDRAAELESRSRAARRKSSRTTAWCWRPARRRSCRPIPGARPPGCFVYRTIEDLEAIRDGRAPRGRRGRGDRRRPARPGGGQRAAQAGPRDPRGRVRAAPDGAAGRRGGRRRPARAASRSWASRCTPARSTTEIVADPRRARVRHALRRRRRAGRRPGGVLGGHPAARRAGARGRADRSARAAASSSTSAAAPPTRTIFAIGECASYDGRCYGLVAPGYQMARRRGRGSCSAATSAFTRLRHEHQAQADGRRRGQLRRRLRHRARRARASASSTRSTAVYKKLVLSRRRQAPAGRHAGGRRLGLRRSCCQLARTRSSLPPHPEELILPAGARASSAAGAGRRRAARRAPDLLLPQRQQGRDLQRHPRAEADRGRRGQERAPRPAPAAARA